MQNIKIIIASDHAGFELKATLSAFLKSTGYEVEDVGAHQYHEDDDYPDFIDKVAKKVSENPNEVRGIIIGGSGQGEAIAANRFAHVRTALYYGGNMKIVELSREHNDANILSLGARFVSPVEAQKAVKLWLNTPFSNDERHVRRIKKIENNLK